MIFTTFTTDDTDLNRLQTNCKTHFTELYKNILRNAIFVENVSLVSGANKLDNKLNRIPRGIIIVSNVVNCTIYNNSFDSKLFITLNASADTTISYILF